MYYIEYINDRKNEEVRTLSIEALNQQNESQLWMDTKTEWQFNNQDLYFPFIWQQAIHTYGPPGSSHIVRRMHRWIGGIDEE